ncbi:MAG: glycosyltransferase family 1 protein [Saprospiraceae bacterium]|nr:glycosyltransferase family 1 protein [Saprospiraceae bacterium]
MNIDVLLVFRKPKPGEHFSIERSFNAMLAAYTSEWFVWRRWTAPGYSTGIIPRLRSMMALKCCAAGIYHITGDVHFLALATPGARTVVTVHDCNFLRLYYGWARQVIKKLWLDWPVRHAAIVVAVSEATRQEVIAFTGCRPEKVLVIPSAIPRQFKPVPYPAGRQDALPCVLHIGTAPNKNLEGHVQALRDIPCRLLILGRLTEAQQTLLEASGIAYENRFDLSDDSMQEVYAQCDLLLFASTAEGFGMPILEAQTVGRPVVTANCSSMPEVAGDGACLVNPFDPADIRKGVLKVLQDPAYRRELIDAGLLNVGRFQPEAAAVQYERIYRSLMP